MIKDDLQRQFHDPFPTLAICFLDRLPNNERDLVAVTEGFLSVYRCRGEATMMRLTAVDPRKLTFRNRATTRSLQFRPYHHHHPNELSVAVTATGVTRKNGKLHNIEIMNCQATIIPRIWRTKARYTMSPTSTKSNVAGRLRARARERLLAKR